jgi:hypothetical protein
MPEKVWYAAFYLDGELIKLQCAGSVAEYLDQFLKLLAQCDGVTEQQQIAIYTAGLGDPLRINVELQRPVTVEDAMGLSRSYERRNLPVEPLPASGRTSTRLGGATCFLCSGARHPNAHLNTTTSRDTGCT